MIKNFTYLLILWLLGAMYACKDKNLEATVACSGTIADQNANHPKKAVYQTIINKYIKQGLPGIVLLVRDVNGVFVGVGGKADIARNIPMQSCQISKIASITKTFVGVLAMKLVEDGVLNLDTKISQYLPNDIISRVRNAEKVTLRQLLNHSTGIYDIIDDNTFYLDVVNNPTKARRGEDLLQFVYDKEPDFIPDGIKVGYSNTNTLLVSMIIDRITGVHHEKLIRERIFQPLGLQNSYYFPEDRIPATTAQGYFDLYNNGTILNMSNYNTSSGYGGIYSTVNDMRVFCEALLRSKTLVSPASYAEMTQWTTDDGDNTQFGLGLFRNFINRPADEIPLGHSGRDLAYSADMYYFPTQDATMTWLVNYGGDAKSNLKPVLLAFEKEVMDEIVK
jgi:D-alanyl-D-alanine carboxypeptidase